MKIVIRADASIKMGSGHVMRCLALAESLREKVASIIFISRKHEGNLNQLIIEKGLEVIELKQPKTDNNYSNKNEDIYKDWLGVNVEEDAEDTIKAIGDVKPDWLIIDHYSLGEKWEKELRPYVNNIFVIDDLANRKHDCNILVDQNWFENMNTRYDELVPIDCTKLLGPKFALLRPEFAEARKSLTPRNETIKRVFVFFGGSDPKNLTAMTLRALSTPKLAHLQVDVVIGANNPHQEEISKMAKAIENVNLHIQVNNMATIMAKADLAIGGGGVNTWERLCLNIFSLVITIANNQINVIKDLNNYKYLIFLGNYKKINQINLGAQIGNYIYNVDKNNKNTMLVDGLGASRIENILSRWENNLGE